MERMYMNFLEFFVNSVISCAPKIHVHGICCHRTITKWYLVFRD
jgi:hypothetical protein